MDSSCVLDTEICFLFYKNLCLSLLINNDQIRLMPVIEEMFRNMKRCRQWRFLNKILPLGAKKAVLRFGLIHRVF
jgi:hypothetical protein